jgi:hypothetical protein
MSSYTQINIVDADLNTCFSLQNNNVKITWKKFVCKINKKSNMYISPILINVIFYDLNG